MRIDLTRVAAGTILAHANFDVTNSNQPKLRHEAVAAEANQLRSDQPASLPASASQQLSVSIDQERNTIYRFTDAKTGELVRQVPPEEILRIMRSIENLMQASEHKLKATL